MYTNIFLFGEIILLRFDTRDVELFNNTVRPNQDAPLSIC